MYRIGKKFHFSASHNLTDLPEGHPCPRVHGHNYVVTLELASEELDVTGFIVDFKELNVLRDWIDDTLDHRHLNDVFDHPNVTTEWLCKYIYDWCKERWIRPVRSKSQKPRRSGPSTAHEHAADL